MHATVMLWEHIIWHLDMRAQKTDKIKHISMTVIIILLFKREEEQRSGEAFEVFKQLRGPWTMV